MSGLEEHNPSARISTRKGEEEEGGQELLQSACGIERKKKRGNAG